MSAVHAEPDHRIAWALLQLAAHRTPHSIANHLHQTGIRGDHGCDTCPIATYLLQQTGLQVRVARGWWNLPGQPHRWTTPQPVTDFVNNYDRDHYPHLNRGAPEVTA